MIIIWVFLGFVALLFVVPLLIVLIFWIYEKMRRRTIIAGFILYVVILYLIYRLSFYVR